MQLPETYNIDGLLGSFDNFKALMDCLLNKRSKHIFGKIYLRIQLTCKREQNI